MSDSRNNMKRDIRLLLGDGMVDVDLDPSHIDLAIDIAIDRYRLRSGNSTETSFVFLEVQPNQQLYTLPDEVQDVQEIFRRGTSQGGGGTAVDPFSLALTQGLYMMQGAGSLGGGGTGQLALYDLSMGFQEMVGRMFGREVQFTFSRSSKKLMMQRVFHNSEEVMLQVLNTRPEVALFADPYARPWLRDYALARCKQMLGEARSKYQSLAGPQGGITMNGDALKAEAVAEMERLELEMVNLIDQDSGYSFVIG